MQVKYFLILLLCTCSYTNFLYGQGHALQGSIYDTKNSTLPGASVVITNSADSVKMGTAADDKGHFSISNLSAGKYVLRISFLGFETYKTTVRIVDADVNLGKLSLQEAANSLSEVKIVEKILAVTQKDDTTEFNAGAYKTNPDADAADLVKKMPGVAVEGKDVKAQGESVTKVLIDGKPFFGTDPYASLRNLPAEVIAKVQVYNEKSDQEQFTGFSEGKTTKTINIITKLDKRNGDFGKFYLGAGSDNDNNKYLAGVTLNKFNGDERITVTAQTNNVNIQNFSDQDLVGMGSKNAGTSITRSLGINYNNKIGKKIDFNGSYSFNQNDNTAERFTRRQYVLPVDSGQVYNEVNDNASNSYSHRFYLRVNYNIDSMNMLTIDPQLSLQQNFGNSFLSGNTAQSGDTLNKTVNNNKTTTLGYVFSGNFLYRHKFLKKGRTFSINANLSNNHNNGTSLLNAQNLFYQNPLLSDTAINEKTNNAWNNWGITGNANYTEPLGKNSQLQLQYTINTQPANSVRNTNDYSIPDKAYIIYDTALSNTFTSQTTTQKFGGSYQYGVKKLTFSAGLYYQYADLYNDQTAPYPFSVNRAYNNVLPVATFQYKFSDKQNLHINYSTSTSTPSVTQLQNVINNTNPLQLTTGNPDLKQPYSHNLLLRYSLSGKKQATMFYATINGSYIENVISNKSIIADSDMVLAHGIILPKGSQLTMPVNINGAWRVYANMSYGMPVKAIKSNLNFTIFSGVTNTPGIINNVINNAENKNGGLGITLSSNISENVDFTLLSNTSINSAQNSINANINTVYYNQTNTLTFNWIIVGGFVFNTQLNYQANSGLSAGYNQNYLLWNASIGKKFFRKRQGDLRLTVFDILKQNNSIQHSVTESYISDVRSNILQRYFMLTFTYNIRNFHQ